jgi:malate synthase
MTVYVDRAGLQIASALAEFVEAKALPGTGVQADALWQGLADILARFVPVNRTLLAKRDEIQTKLDAWHKANPGPILEIVIDRNHPIGRDRPGGDRRCGAGSRPDDHHRS